ncbi:hypothetical protein [Agitococcus lubricus]|uniref:Uncharacterized protein n=1 Tax=Agitococcus lubricus TaxID=1077255 RepID=A0A2T5IZ13_9GAMM|nr:hypothetical protein [Agitococcus lubricus]PTQ89273.1 hypothetical protein C8N29_1071 [Agitococcus lubricus]
MQCFNEYGQTINPILLSHGPYVVVDNDYILYPDSHHFIKYDPLTGKREDLFISCKKAIAFAFNQTHLIWLDHHQAHIYHLSGKLNTTFIKKHYTLEPLLQAHPHGGFLMSDGIANQKLIWLTVDGEQIRSWQLCGPILALTVCNQNILVACAALGKSENLAFYLLSDDSCQEHQETMCIGKIISQEGHLAWLRKDRHIMLMNEDFTPYSIGILPENHHLMAFSPSLSYIASLSITADTYECQLWQIHPLQEAYHV